MIQLSNEQMRKIIQEETEKFLNSPYDESFDLVLEKKSKRQRKKQAQRAQNQKITQAQQAAAAAKKAESPMDLGLTPDEEPTGQTKSQRTSAQTDAQRKKVAAAMKAQTAAGKATQLDLAKQPPAAETTALAKTNDPKTGEPLEVDPKVAAQLATPKGKSWYQKLAQSAKEKGSAWLDKQGGLAGLAKTANVKGGAALTDLGKRVAYAGARGLGDLAAGTIAATGRGIGGALGGGARSMADSWNQGKAFSWSKGNNSPQNAMAKIKKAGLTRQDLQLALQAMSESQLATKRLASECIRSGKIKIVKEEKEPIIIDV